MRGYQLGDFGSMGETSSTISEFTNKIKELMNVQKKVDAGLANMPSGPEKDRLLKLKEESRGIFSKYILPAYNTVKNYLGNAMSGDDMGFLPLIPIAAVAGATAALGYVTKSLYTEYKILNDPSFSAAQKTAILSAGGLSSISGAIGNTKNLLIVLGIGFVLFQVWKMKKESA